MLVIVLISRNIIPTSDEHSGLGAKKEERKVD